MPDTTLPALSILETKTDLGHLARSMIQLIAWAYIYISVLLHAGRVARVRSDITAFSVRSDS